MPSNEEHTPLLSCPFCGGEARHESIHDGEFEEICCSNCDYQICSSAIDGDLAEHWNRRAGEAALVEALEGAEKVINQLVQFVVEEGRMAGDENADDEWFAEHGQAALTSIRAALAAAKGESP